MINDDEINDDETYSGIADFLTDALRAAEEARGLAESKWGEEDERTERLLELWCDTETLFREFHKEDKQHAHPT